MAEKEMEQMLALVEEGFQKAAWHGPNLRSALRGVSVERASWRPEKGRHNIWEIAVHAAYWKYAVTKRLTGSKKHEFPEKGRNWFARDARGVSKGEAAKNWKRDLALLSKTHKELREAIAKMTETELEGRCRGSRQTVKQNVVGIAMHDVYHAGQIQLLKKLRERKGRGR
ncbi:MAG TPA: DinB family protein [Candidatus Acidoferrales bacterium]|nr:DinB family protein [Candidatus Acidoferrales bacterium]